MKEEKKKKKKEPARVNETKKSLFAISMLL